MSAPDPTTTDEPADDDAQIVVNDPEDLAKTRMLRSVFDALDEYRRTRRKTNRAVATDELGELDRRRLVFEAFQQILLSAEPLFSETDDGKEIWEEKEYSLHSSAINVPKRQPHGVSSGGKRRFEQGDRAVTGLRSFVAGHTFYTMVGGSRKASKRVVTASPGPETCNQGYRDVTAYLSDIGLGIDLGEETQTKIDDDTLDELEEWRQKNV